MDLLTRMLEHNAWVIRNLLDMARPLTDEQFHQRFEIGPGTVHDTIGHMIRTISRWSDRVSNRPERLPVFVDERLSIDDLAAHLKQADRDFNEAATTIARDSRLNEVMTFHSTGDSQTYAFTRGSAILHVINHTYHHGAQVLNMLRRLGVENLRDLDPLEWEIETYHPQPPRGDA